MFYSTYMLEHYMTIKNYFEKHVTRRNPYILIISGKIYVYRMILII